VGEGDAAQAAAPPRTKIRPPPPEEHLLRRARLERLLDDLTQRPVTVLVAPAGAGKTTLVADWCRRTAAVTAWVDLEVTDAHPVALWSLVTAALDRVRPGVWSDVEPLLRAADVDGVLARLSTWDPGTEPMRLIVDNLHHLETDAEAGRTFARFVQHLPAGLHLVLLTRHRPESQDDRMRAAGTLAEIGFTELRFSVAESVSLLSDRQPDLPPAEVARLARRADGWVAALQLMALAARTARAMPVPEDREDAADHLLDRYVRRAVLADQPAELVSLLVDTSGVEQVSPGLAETLTGRPDAGDLLADAERRSLLVTRLPRGWFQQHPLLREALLAELGRGSQTRLLDQHVRAARWFEDTGNPVDAVKHYTDAGRYVEALQALAAASSGLYDSGRQADTIRLLQRIPVSAARADLRTMQNLALCQLASGSSSFLESVALLGTYEQVTSEVSPALRGRTKTLQLMARLMTGWWQGSEALALGALTDLGPGALLDPIGRFSWNLVARGVALTESWEDSTPTVVRAKTELSLDPERRLALQGTRALGLALSGRPVDALRVAAGVWRAADLENLSVLRAEISLAEGLASSELGDEPRGRLRLAELASVESPPVPYVQVLAALALVEDLVREGEIDLAKVALARAETLARVVIPGPDGIAALSRVGVLVALADGDLERAQGWYERCDDPFWAPVSLARILIARDETPQAREALAQAVPRCARHEVVKALLQAVVAGSSEDAARHVTAAVERASDLGLLTTVATEGRWVRELIELSAWRVPQEWLERLRLRTAPAVADLQPVTGTPERLTPRELDVLRLLPSRLTQKEIARELFLSPNTLKFHLRVIYRKLGVHGRAEAVAASRRSGPPGHPGV
jgi:LuxR family maltose regulon positive regulatory protein